MLFRSREAASHDERSVNLRAVSIGGPCADEGRTVRCQIEVLDVPKFVVKDVAVQVHPRCGAIHAELEGIDRLSSHQAALHGIELRKDVAAAVTPPHAQGGCERVVRPDSSGNLVAVGTLIGVSVEEYRRAVRFSRRVSV